MGEPGHAASGDKRRFDGARPGSGPIIAVGHRRPAPTRRGGSRVGIRGRTVLGLTTNVDVCHRLLVMPGPGVLSRAIFLCCRAAIDSDQKPTYSLPFFFLELLPGPVLAALGGPAMTKPCCLSCPLASRESMKSTGCVAPSPSIALPFAKYTLLNSPQIFPSVLSLSPSFVGRGQYGSLSQYASAAI